MLLLVALASAAAPAHLPVQARLLDGLGVPLEDTVSVNFALYTAPTGGTPVFSELRTVDPTNGYFSVFLGEVNTLDWSVVDGSAPLYLGITLPDSAELARQPVGTVPFAAFADRAARADIATDSEHLEGLDVDGVVAEVVATYPSIVNPYEDADAVAAMGGAANSNPLNHTRYTDTEAVSAMGSASNSNPLHHNRYADADAVGAMGSTSNSNPLNHTRYTNSDAVGAMGSTSNANPLNHTRYTDSNAVSAVAAADDYVSNSGDTVSGPLYTGGGLASSPSSPLVLHPWMTTFFRASNGDIHFTDGTGTDRTLVVGDGTASVYNDHIAYQISGNAENSGILHFNIDGVPSMACTLLSAEDDVPRSGMDWSTDIGNNVSGAWGGAEVRSFSVRQFGGSKVPIAINTSYRILCF